MSKKIPLLIKIGGTIEVYPGGTFESKVVKSGNGAVIHAFKKYIGEDVLVIIEKKIKKSKKTMEDVLEHDSP